VFCVTVLVVFAVSVACTCAQSGTSDTIWQVGSEEIHSFALGVHFAVQISRRVDRFTVNDTMSWKFTNYVRSGCNFSVVFETYKMDMAAGTFVRFKFDSSGLTSNITSLIQTSDDGTIGRVFHLGKDGER
jgi:hypothetical protein